MSKEAVFTMKLESELRDAFMSAAEAAHRPASQIVRELMRTFVRQQQEGRAYNAWLDTDLERAIQEANDPNATWHDHADSMDRARQLLLKRASQSSDTK